MSLPDRRWTRPLARLDREHQERLLSDYFPKLARQVILLPTNSEVDRARYELLRPHVYRQYRLTIGATGDETRCVEQDMYAGAQP
jgi:DNA sulfur modification protein DndD